MHLTDGSSGLEVSAGTRFSVVRIDKLVHGGQGLGVLPDGRKVFVWNGLPGELVRVRLLKSKRSYAQAIAEEIVEPSLDRIEALESNFLSTSPWQILELAAENRYKADITRELFVQAGIRLPDFTMETAGDTWQYRNKMEYSFWGDENGLYLALHRRGSHGKQIVTGCRLALPAVDSAANAVLEVLKGFGIRASELKTIIVRVSQIGETAVSLFVKRESFPELSLPKTLKGMRVYYSDPKSPAPAATKLLYQAGDGHLQDKLLGKPFVYDADSFFQVNLPAFTQALTAIQPYVTESITDMYAGVGVLGLSLASRAARLVEPDPATAAMARINAGASGIKAEVFEIPAEKALGHITPDLPVIFDPPRAGLHRKVIGRLLEQRPPRVIYLSCNPATQARDVASLLAGYRLAHFAGFNFFPRTPHIESLCILEKI